MDKEYVQQYGELENTHWWFVVRSRIILQAINKQVAIANRGGLKILNAGAAAGASSRWLSTLGEVVSLENDPEFISYLLQQDIPVIQGSIENIPFPDNSFDIVCALDVIEHVADDARAVEELVRVCKAGGLVCITVPAFESLWGEHDIVNGHYRRYRKPSLAGIIAPQRVKMIYSTYFNGILFGPVFLFRKIQWWLGKRSRKPAADFHVLRLNALAGGILKALFGIEVFLLKNFTLPFGVSLMALLRKDAPVAGK
jgi:SAM-dependent methyltransferase